MTVGAPLVGALRGRIVPRLSRRATPRSGSAQAMAGGRWRRSGGGRPQGSPLRVVRQRQRGGAPLMDNPRPVSRGIMPEARRWGTSEKQALCQPCVGAPLVGTLFRRHETENATVPFSRDPSPSRGPPPEKASGELGAFRTSSDRHHSQACASRNSLRKYGGTTITRHGCGSTQTCRMDWLQQIR